jgi:hypothetical protein
MTRKLVGALVACSMFGGLSAPGVLAQPLIESNDICSSADPARESVVLILLEGNAEWGEVVEIEIVVRHRGERILSETYGVRMPPAPPRDYLVLPAWLDGLGSAEQKLAEAFLDQPSELEVELVIGGVPGPTQSLEAILAMHRMLQESAFESVAIEALHVEDPVTVEDSVTTEDVIATKSAFTCPNNHPFCRDQRMDCVIGCDFEQSCVTACYEQQALCVSGHRSIHTTKTLVARQPYDTICGYYPWYEFASSKRWNRYFDTYDFRRYENIYCPPTGEDFQFTLEEWTDTGFCHLKLPQSCSSGTYMGGKCRLN